MRRKAPVTSEAEARVFAGLFAAAKALESVYQAHVDGRPVEIPLSAFHDFVEMIGFQKVWDFEEKYADLLAVEIAASAT